jgi:hypothetical protein
VQIGQDLSGSRTNDQFGSKVSMNSDGTRVAIASPYYDGLNNNTTDAGYVRIFQYNTSLWTQIGGTLYGEAANNSFGLALSMNSIGNVVAIGAPGNIGIGQVQTGYVRIFQYIDNSWNQFGSITGSNNEGFGTSVSLNGDGTKLAIGAAYNDLSGTDAGIVRVYQYSSGSWSQIAYFTGKNANDWCGYAVSMSSDGNRVGIGIQGSDVGGNNAGIAQVYQNSSGTWTQLGGDLVGPVSASDPTLFGSSVSLSSNGNRFAIGGAWYDPGSAMYSGVVKVFEYIGNSWTLLPPVLYGEIGGQYFGISVSLNSDGSILAVGMFYNSVQLGAVRIYSYNGSWQVVATITGQTSAGFWQERLGASVSLSSDGGTFAAGAPINDIAAQDAGAVRVYQLQKQNSNLSWSNYIIPTKTVADSSFVLTAPSTISDGTITYYSSNTNVMTISGSIVTILTGGYTDISAVQSSTAQYNAATVSQRVVVIPYDYYHEFYSYSITNSTILNRKIYNSSGVLKYSEDLSYGGMSIPNVLAILDDNGTTPYCIGIVDTSFNKVQFDLAYADVFRKAFSDTEKTKLITYVNTNFKEPHTIVDKQYIITLSNSLYVIKDVSNTIVSEPLVFTSGYVYLFDQSDSTNIGNTLKLSTTQSTLTEITSGITKNGTPGSLNAYTMISPSSTLSTVYLYNNLIFYYVKVQYNAISQPVFAISTSSSGTYYNQLNLTFTAGNKYKFDVSDPSVAGFNLVFGNVDALYNENINSSLYTAVGTPGTAGAYVMLDVAAGYSGPTINYFEDSSKNMGLY